MKTRQAGKRRKTISDSVKARKRKSAVMSSTTAAAATDEGEKPSCSGSTPTVRSSETSHHASAGEGHSSGTNNSFESVQNTVLATNLINAENLAKLTNQVANLRQALTAQGAQIQFLARNFDHSQNLVDQLDVCFMQNRDSLNKSGLEVRDRVESEVAQFKECALGEMYQMHCANLRRQSNIHS